MPTIVEAQRELSKAKLQVREVFRQKRAELDAEYVQLKKEIPTFKGMTKAKKAEAKKAMHEHAQEVRDGLALNRKQRQRLKQREKRALKATV